MASQHGHGPPPHQQIGSTSKCVQPDDLFEPLDFRRPSPTVSVCNRRETANTPIHQLDAFISSSRGRQMGGSVEFDASTTSLHSFQSPYRDRCLAEEIESNYSTPSRAHSMDFPRTGAVNSGASDTQQREGCSGMYPPRHEVRNSNCAASNQHVQSSCFSSNRHTGPSDAKFATGYNMQWSANARALAIPPRVLSHCGLNHSIPQEQSSSFGSSEISQLAPALPVVSSESCSSHYFSPPNPGLHPRSYISPNPPGFYPYSHHPQNMYAGSLIAAPINYINGKPSKNDVLCGRGGATNNHQGNRMFRSLVNTHRERYLECKKKEKPAVAAYVVGLVRMLDPPGRFLKTDRANGLYYDIGDDKAKEKTAQALREGAPALRRMKERGAPADSSCRLSSTKDGSPGSNALADASFQGTSSLSDSHDGSGTDSGGSSSRIKKRVVEVEEVVVRNESDDYSVDEEAEPFEDAPENGAKPSSDEGRDEESRPQQKQDEVRESCCDNSTELKRKPNAIYIRPVLQLTKKKLSDISVQELSPEDQVLYKDFLPPRPSLNRGPRTKLRKVIRVTDS